MRYCGEAYALEVYSGNWKAQDALPNLNTPRYDHGSCVVGDKLYVIAGKIGIEITSSIEMLAMKLNDNLSIAFESNSWTQI